MTLTDAFLILSDHSTTLSSAKSQLPIPARLITCHFSKKTAEIRLLELSAKSPPPVTSDYLPCCGMGVARGPLNGA